jgi:voltage-gated potassium channel
MTKLQKIKTRIASILEPANKNDKISGYFDVFIEILVLTNVVAVIVESFENIYAANKTILDIFEIFTVSIFSAEFILRIWISDIKYPAKSKLTSVKKFFLSPNAWIDFLAIMPFFVPYWIQIDLRHLRVLRLVRLMRVFKLTKYSHAMVLIGKILSEKKQELLATFLLMFSVLVLASSVMYYLERDAQPEAFPNILYGFWWGVVTLCTVGYGDTVPITGAGKLLGGVVALMGVMIVAIPTGIISSSFIQKMEESKSIKRMREIRKKLKEAFYKKYVPELATRVRRGQLSVDAVKVNLELSENDVYKIAEGKNEFRFRYKKVIQNGLVTDKLFLEYREINTNYGTLTNRNSNLTLVSPESLNKQSIGYFVYCIAEKLKCNYISNEFFGDESTASEESFGDSGLELETAFSFRHNKAYLKDYTDAVPEDFMEWKADLLKIKQENSIYLIFNTFEHDSKNAVMSLSYLKGKHRNPSEDYTFKDAKKIDSFKKALIKNTEEKYGLSPVILENVSSYGVKDNNILLYINEDVDTDVMLINICQDYIVGEKIFPFAAMMADSIKEGLMLEVES